MIIVYKRKVFLFIVFNLVHVVEHTKFGFPDQNEILFQSESYV